MPSASPAVPVIVRDPPGTEESAGGVDRPCPTIGGVRHHFSSPWHYGQSMDLPWRHGDRSFGDVTWGQSSIAADIGPLSIGASTENEWWGPGVRNALILSNNAAGFPKIFLRTARPIRCA